MTPGVRGARLLFIHAHPDDETLTTGLTMASYASRHHEVHLLTCTLGEQGEVIPADYAHLAADRDDTLGARRREELRSAMSILNVAHCVLGEDPARGVASRYRDSGMAGTSGAEHPDAFVRADPAEATALMAAHIRAVRPDVVVTYDEQGGYAHPDHIQTHRLTMSALSTLAAEAESQRAAVAAAFCILTPASWAAQDRSWLRDTLSEHSASEHLSPDRPQRDHFGKSEGSNWVVPQQDDPYPPSVVPDEIVTHIVHEPALVGLQSRALAQHVTQVEVREGYYALSNHIAGRLGGREGFAQFDPVAGRLVSAPPDAPRVHGLLNGLLNGLWTDGRSEKRVSEHSGGQG